MTILPLFTLHLSSAAKTNSAFRFLSAGIRRRRRRPLFWFPRHKKAAFQAALNIFFSADFFNLIKFQFDRS